MKQGLVGLMRGSLMSDWLMADEVTGLLIIKGISWLVNGWME